MQNNGASLLKTTWKLRQEITLGVLLLFKKGVPPSWPWVFFFVLATKRGQR